MEPVRLSQRLVFDDVEYKGGDMRNLTVLGITMLAVVVLAALAVLIALAPRLPTPVVQASVTDRTGALQTSTDGNAGIVVSGQGTASAKPDIAVASIGVEITAPNLSDATSQNTTKMNAVLDKIKSLGVADKDIQTVNYSVTPIQAQNRPDSNTPPAITGYRVSNQVRVTIRKIDDLGKVLDQAIAAGANRVYGVSFSVDDPSTFQQQARAAAIKDAQDKAGQLAKNAGLQLGPVLSISEGSSGPRPMLAAADAYNMAEAAVPIQTGELQIAVTVQMRFGIK